MYGIVLMAALTTGANAPDCHRAVSYGCSGCVGYSCAGCYGSYSCAGCYGSYSCAGCYGSYGCSGCYGGGYMSYQCHGCYGCYGCYGCAGCYGGVILPTAPVMPGKEQAPLPKPADEKKKEEEVRAKLTVELPADAVLYIDGVKMKTTAERRVFSTPALVPGQAFFYDLKAEIVRDGQTLSETARVIVRAGEEAHATFATLANPPVTSGAVAGR